MSEPKYTGTEVELYTKQFGQRLEALTGRIGCCVSRDLDQTSLLDTTKLKMIGSIIEFARSNWEVLPQHTVILSVCMNGRFATIPPACKFSPLSVASSSRSPATKSTQVMTHSGSVVVVTRKAHKRERP